MEEGFLSLELTSNVIKTVVAEIISPKIARDNIKMRKKLERAHDLIQELDRGNIDYCNNCYDVLRDKNRRQCDDCYEWNCQRCISAGELSPIHHICDDCSNSFCDKCIKDIETPNICITCKTYYCGGCYGRHLDTHPQ
jgi:hypothetical protein